MITRCALRAVAFAALSVASVSAARAAGPCSNDSFAVDGSQLRVEVCDRAAAAPHGTGGTLVETLSVKDRPPVVHAVPYDRLPNETTTRTIDDVPLQALGIARTLHLTVAIRDRSVRLEHALLVPGAIDLR